MKKISYQKEVLASWRKCINTGISMDAESPSICIQTEELERKRREKSEQVAAFQSCMDRITDYMPTHTAFLLVDSGGILLKKNK